MIAGFGGELISHAYLEQHIAANPDAARDADFERHIVRWWRLASRSLGPASSARAVQDVAVNPLLTLLGHEAPAMSQEPYGLRGRLPSANGVLLVLPWSCPPAGAWRKAMRSGLTSGAAWAWISNGRRLRIADCSRTWTRAGIEFEFDRLVLGASGIAALRGLAHANVVPALRSRIEASDAHASGVCRSISDGVLASLPRLATALAAGTVGRRHRETALDQSLTLVYRVLFLLFAEAHGLVPMWNDVYRQAYTIASLTDRAADPAAPGLWRAFQAISRLAHAGCRAGDLDVTAFNGRLFSPRHAPLMEQRRVPDGVIRDVLLSLATENTKQGRRRISYYDLGVEQLGSVYERVLDYEPAAQPGVVRMARTSNRRKSTGSFYTPRSLTEFLVRQALSPLVDGRSADQILGLRVCDPAMGSGAFLVAACRYLADACEHALLRDGEWLEADATAGNRATLRRHVAERCLYGVDLNATAVQLARLSLWLTTLAADRPLTFLDHHLAAGNSLIGARLSDLSQPSMPQRSKRSAPLPLFDDLIADDVTQILPARLQLAMEPSDSLAVVKHKERTFARLTKPGGPIDRLTAAADAWCAARLWTGTPPSAGVVNEWIAAAIGTPTSLPEMSLRASLNQARTMAAAHGAFHWELAFPEVFLDHGGRPHALAGFDAVIGNPPWDMLRADSGSSIDRRDARSMTAAALRFCRSSHAYLHQGTGHPNSYQLFLERSLSLVKPDGRVGLILPSGIATDHGSSALRRRLFDRTTVDAWIGFDNRARVFPIHRSMRFVVLTATNGGRTDTLQLRCGVTNPETLEHTGAVTHAISRARLESWSPDHLTIPEITSRAALGILTNIADRVPALGHASGWQVRFGRELNATDDRPHFAPLGRHPHDWLPIVEGKQLRPFGIDLDRSTLGIPRTLASTLLDAASSFDRDRIAYRDVAAATNKLTLIAAMLPRGSVSTHTVFCLKTPLDQDAQWCLLGLLNSLVANYLVRLQVTTHVTTALMARLPVPRPPAESAEFCRLVELSRLIAVSNIEATVDEYAEVNSIAARLYSVSNDQYAHVLDSFPLIPENVRAACLAVHVRATETRKHGAN